MIEYNKNAMVANEILDMFKFVTNHTVKKKIINHNQKYYNIFGLQSRFFFKSLPILDFCIFEKKNINSDKLNLSIKNFSKLEILIPGNNSFFDDLKDKLYKSKKNNYLISTSLDFNNYLLTLNSKRRSQLKNIKINYNFFEFYNPNKLLIDEFYILYFKRIKLIGSIPLPKYFFIKLFQFNYKKTTPLLCLVRDEQGLLVSGSILFQILDSRYLMFAASTNENNSNLFLYREMIRICCESTKINFLYLGRSTINSPNEKFKLNFSPEIIPLYTFKESKKNRTNYFYFSWFLKNISDNLLVIISKFFYKYYIS
jgi:hypothetical protein